MGRLTAIFTKQPSPGAVKTRLCPPLSAEEAARLAEAMLRDTVERTRAESSWTTALVFAPANSAAWFRATFPGIERQEVQQGTGLGERLALYFESRFAEEPDGTTVVVGSDAPLCENAIVLEAHRALEAGSDLVLAPDAGGGYVLIGQRRPRAELFLDVPMSTGDMAARTLELARRLDLRTHVLPAGFDVDEEADLERLARELGARRGLGRDVPTHTLAALIALGRVPSRT